ncbi:MAG: molybdopterin cofactor-binding domain-containing protein, partial [Telluria sp.]
KEARERVAERNLNAPPNIRHGVGIAAFFFCCGNTAKSNPSTIRIGVLPDGTVALHQGAVDAGQGSNTVIPQIAADAIGIALGELKIVGPNTNLTPDAGRTSASRQTFVSGQAALLSGKALREKILGLLGTGQSATLHFGGGKITAVDGNRECHLDVHSLPLNSHGYVLMAEETFDPITTGLDASGRGSPYAVYAFGAQMSEVWVDCESGDVRVVRVVAAHDVGRAVNPTLLEGQIEGAVAQGVGMALMEKFVAGVSNNLHDYLIPTVFDMPKVKCIFIEEPTSAGPYGAKGIGEPALVPTAASIFNAIYDAIGVRITSAPATPEVVSRAIRNC